MSHIATVSTMVKDATALAAACRKKGLAEPQKGTYRLFSGQATGLGVNLPGWSYPVVFDETTGAAKYDNYNGAWGKDAELDSLLETYAVEKIRQDAEANGASVLSERQLENGDIELELEVR